jgi:Secretion system C-terminal sorting domain
MALNLNGGNMVDLYRIDPLTGNLSLEIPLPSIAAIVSTTMSFHQATSTYLFVGIDTANNYHLYQCNTVYDTISYGLLPGIDVIEIEADNSLFAFNKYLATGIQVPQAAALRVYPNPSADIVRIEGADLVNLHVYDTQGRLIVEQSGSNLAQIEVGSWTPGFYFLQGQARDGQLVGAKFIKE